MEEYNFIEAKKDDLQDICNIYNYYIENTTATFHTELLKPLDVKDYIFTNHPRYKTYLIKNGKILCGYCLLTCYKNRPAYDRAGEIVIYLNPEFTGRGIGKLAISYIEKSAIKNNFKVLISIICGENTASINLFKKAGYEKCAHFKEVGEKFGRVLDVVAFQKIL